MEHVLIAQKRKRLSFSGSLLPEVGLLLAGLLLFYAMPEDLGFATRILIGGLFALSLDLVLGYAGIVTLGHAAMFGVGAYAAGISTNPLFGQFEFDFLGRTGFFYALAVLLLAFAFLRRLVRSPFGLTNIGIREDRDRMASLGCLVNRHLTIVYAIGGALAGIAGALSAQITQVVGLSSLGFAHSAEVLVMLVLGGTGRLYGALVGTVVFMVVHHFAAAVDPFRWMFVIGGLLLVVVLFMRGGITGALVRLANFGSATGSTK